MSIMKMYVEEYLAAEQVAEDRYIIHLSNGKEIEVTEHPVHNGNMWDWKIDSQVFDGEFLAMIRDCINTGSYISLIYIELVKLLDESLVPGCFEARKIFAEKQRAKREAERAQREAEEAAYVKERNEAAQKKVAQAIETLKNGGRLVNFDVEIFKSRYHSSSYSIFNYLARQYGVKIPIKTQGWINSSLLDITVKDGKMSGGHMSGKNQSTVIYKYMNQLIEAVRKDA